MTATATKAISTNAKNPRVVKLFARFPLEKASGLDFMPRYNIPINNKIPIIVSI